MKVATLTVALLTPLCAADRVLFDFESGDYAGWTVEGKAFGEKPRDPAAEMPSFHPHRTFTGWKGKYMVMVGDARHQKVPPGKLTSAEFIIDKPYLNFWYGGEIHPRVSVSLLVQGKRVRVAYGNNSYDMRLRGWDVRDLRGRQARIVVECSHDVAALLRLDHFYLSDEPPPLLGRMDDHRQESDLVRNGEWRLVFDPGPGILIDHMTVVQGPDPRWHIFASTMPLEGRYKPEARNRILHISAPRLTSSDWTVHPDALTTSREHGEDFLWEPFVLVDNGVWYMFYVGSGTPWKGWDKNNNWRAKDFGAASTQGPFGIHLATSKDGSTWTRHAKQPLFTDMPFAFTPFVTRMNGEWIMYYAGAEPANVMGKHGVLTRSSTDLIRWSDRRVALLDTTETTPWPEHSFIHSPILTQHAGKWYLIAGPIDNDNQSRFHYRKIFESADPMRFNLAQHRKGLFLEGGSRIVRSGTQDFITYTGPYAGGIWIAPLFWGGAK
jgi:hypothetical protein